VRSFSVPELLSGESVTPEGWQGVLSADEILFKKQRIGIKQLAINRKGHR
jgi:hypothetical protein